MLFSIKHQVLRMNLLHLIMTGVLALSIGLLSLRTIQEGYVGVSHVLGSLHQVTLKPGLHFINPITTRIYQVQTTMQTDYVLNVPCGTNSGVNIMFDKIEVVNQLMESHVYETVKNYTVDYDKLLIFDKITYEMAQFCSKTSLQEVFIEKFDQIDEFLSGVLQRSLDQYAPGLKIISVRLSKPNVPHEVQENYKKIVQYQTEILKSKTEQQKELLYIQTENEKSLSKLNSEKELALSKLKSDQERMIYEIEANKLFELAQTDALRHKEIARIMADEQKKMAMLDMEMIVNAKTIERDTTYKKGQIEVLRLDMEAERVKETMRVDLHHYHDMKNAEYMRQLLTPEYVAIEVSKSIASNSKIFYGDSLPKMFHFPGMGINSPFLNLTNF